MNNELLKYFNGDELAANVWLSKYATHGETSPEQMHRRMAKEFYRIEQKYQSKKGIYHNPGVSDYGRVRTPLDEQKIFDLFHKFKYVIPQGSVMSQLGTPSIGSLSNCFVVKSPYDSYGGIFNTDQELGQLFKRRCGVGVDISTLRPNGTATSNVAKTSTGAVSFMERYSSTTREVAQGGRRGALMLSMDIRHPDIMDFIKIKQDLTKVTGANISVRVSDDFMEAVRNKEDYYLRFPCDQIVKPEDWNHLEYNKLKIIKYGNKEVGSIVRVQAQDIWDALITSAHSSAEPGILFWDTITRGPDGVYPQYIPTSTNPCGEIPIEPNNSCRLIALNLTSFVKNPYQSNAKFNIQKFKRVVYEALRLNDDLVDLELEAVDRIIDKIIKDDEPDDIKQVELNLWKEARRVGEESRRTGLGFTGLGDALAMLNLKYGEDSIMIINDIMHSKMEAELDCTIDMSIERGHFTGWKSTNEFTKGYTGQNAFTFVGNNDFYKMLLSEFPEQAHKMMLYGRRNVSWSTVAPTGSLSMLAQVTSGIEPLFQPFYMRRKKINAHDGDITPDFVDDMGDKWTEHAVLHEEFKKWMIKEGLVPDLVDNLTKSETQFWFERSPWFKSTANDIPWEERIDVQAVIQDYTTHSISSTINLPRDVSKEVVSKIYFDAWGNGLKGVTVYRDGSRDGVLITESKKKQKKFSYQDSIKRPDKVEANAHSTIIGGDKYSVFVGLVDGIPYEVFAYKGGTTDGHGVIFKEGKGQYFFDSHTEGSRSRILSGKMTDEQEAFTRLISRSLRHGSDIRFIVEDLTKTSGSMFSFNSAIAKVLKKYIPDGTKSSAKCTNPDCSGDRTNVIFEEGCYKCLDCGSSACG